MTGLFGHPALPNHDPLVRAAELESERAAQVQKTRDELAAKTGPLIEKAIAAVKALDTGRGAGWADILTAMGGNGAGDWNGPENQLLEDALNLAMDKQLLFEPTLGVLKVC